MAVQLAIRADVVDMRFDAPQVGDRFLVDTNVWFWTTYSWASQTAHPYQVTYFPDFIVKARSSGARLFYSNLSFAELTHSIERAELAIYNASQTSTADITIKEYRHNYPTQRAEVVAEIQAAWGIVEALAEPLDAIIDTPMTTAALASLSVNQVDGYDLFILEAMKRKGINQIITDDGDFTTVSDIQVFTANLNAINLARAQGRLVTR